MIILAATPIGNRGDASPRLMEALRTATVIAAEDTRVTVHLMKALGVENRPRLIPLHEHNETAKAAELIELARDVDVLVLSDAGMPAISDPGFALVSAAAAAGVTVTAIPGPSAVLTTLVREPRTMVFFESPNRLADSLADVATVLGQGRRVAVARELTKMFEEVKRGTAAELTEWASAGVKGEICVVVEGAAALTIDLPTGIAQVRSLGRGRLTAEGCRGGGLRGDRPQQARPV